MLIPGILSPDESGGQYTSGQVQGAVHYVHKKDLTWMLTVSSFLIQVIQVLLAHWRRTGLLSAGVAHLPALGQSHLTKVSLRPSDLLSTPGAGHFPSLLEAASDAHLFSAMIAVQPSDKPVP